MNNQSCTTQFPSGEKPKRTRPSLRGSFDQPLYTVDSERAVYRLSFESSQNDRNQDTRIRKWAYLTTSIEAHRAAAITPI
jgi:hypothetical protein